MNDLARILIRDFRSYAEALRYARRLAAFDGPLADEYHAAANEIAAFIDRQVSP